MPFIYKEVLSLKCGPTFSKLARPSPILRVKGTLPRRAFVNFDGSGVPSTMNGAVVVSIEPQISDILKIILV